MTRMTSGNMLNPGARKAPGKSAQKKKPTAGKVKVAVPKGGHSSVEKADNGVVVTTYDANYRNRKKVVAADIKDVDFT